MNSFTCESCKMEVEVQAKIMPKVMVCELCRDKLISAAKVRGGNV